MLQQQKQEQPEYITEKSLFHLPGSVTGSNRVVKHPALDTFCLVVDTWELFLEATFRYFEGWKNTPKCEISAHLPGMFQHCLCVFSIVQRRKMFMSVGEPKESSGNTTCSVILTCT